MINKETTEKCMWAADVWKAGVGINHITANKNRNYDYTEEMVMSFKIVKSMGFETYTQCRHCHQNYWSLGPGRCISVFGWGECALT